MFIDENCCDKKIQSLAKSTGKRSRKSDNVQPVPTLKQDTTPYSLTHGDANVERTPGNNLQCKIKQSDPLTQTVTNTLITDL